MEKGVIIKVLFLSGVFVFGAWILLRIETTVIDMEKLSEGNFSLWKSQMEDILMLKDKYFPIEVTTKKPSSIMDEMK